MGEYRLKVKIGNSEFEAEGPAEIVERQFADFKKIIAEVTEKYADADQSDVSSARSAADSSAGAESQLDKIFRTDGRIISLTALPSTEADAALLVLLGQREFRKNEAVTGGELMDGLTQSGFTPNRVDRLMEKFVADGLVIRIGRHRSTRYRLTNQGLGRAQAIASDVLHTVP